MISFCFCLIAFYSLGCAALEWQGNPEYLQAWLSPVLPAAILARNFSSQRQTRRLGNLVLAAYGLIFIPGMPAGMGLHIESLLVESGPTGNWLILLSLFAISLGSHLIWFSALHMICSQEQSLPLILGGLITAALAHKLIVIPDLAVAGLQLAVLVWAMLHDRSGSAQPGTEHVKPSGLLLWPAMMAMVPSEGTMVFLPFFFWYGFLLLSRLHVLLHWASPEDEQYIFLLYLGLFLLAGNGFGDVLRHIPALFVLLSLISWQGNDVIDFGVTALLSVLLLLVSGFDAQAILMLFAFCLGTYLIFRMLVKGGVSGWLRALLLAGLNYYMARTVPWSPDTLDKVQRRPELIQHESGWMIVYGSRLLSRSIPLEALAELPPQSRTGYCNHLPLVRQDTTTVLADVQPQGVVSLDGPCLYPYPRPDLLEGVTHVVLQTGQPLQSLQTAQFLNTLPETLKGGILLLWEPAFRNTVMRYSVLEAWNRRFPGSVVQVHNHLLLISKDVRFNYSEAEEMELIPRMGLESLMQILKKPRAPGLRELRQALLLNQLRFMTGLDLRQREDLIVRLLHEELDGLALNLARKQIEMDTLSQFYPMVETYLLNSEALMQHPVAVGFCRGEQIQERSIRDLLTVVWLRSGTWDCQPAEPGVFRLSSIRKAIGEGNLAELSTVIHLGFDLIPNLWQAELMRRGLEILGRGRESTLFDLSLMSRRTSPDLAD